MQYKENIETIALMLLFPIPFLPRRHTERHTTEIRHTTEHSTDMLFIAISVTV